MRYSRLLEENSFSNRRADYVWLLFLCSSFLWVGSDGLIPIIMTDDKGDFTSSDHAFPSLISRVRSGVHLVKTESID